MAVKIRLRKQGRTHNPFFRLVVTDSRSRRDGRYVEALGWYNPLEREEEKSLKIDEARVRHWLSVGAILSESAEALVARSAPSLIKDRKEQELARKLKRRAKKVASKKA